MALTAHAYRHLTAALANKSASSEIENLLSDLDDNLNETGNGASAAATVTAVEKGNSIFHQTVLTLTALPVSINDTNVGGGTKIYDFPAGRVYVLGATASVAFTTTSTLASTLNAGVTLSWGVGSVQTTTQASGTLATTEQNIVNASTATSSATINVAGATATAVGTAVALDGTTTAIDAYFNVGVPTATDIDGNATVTVTGTITLTWVQLGDY